MDEPVAEYAFPYAVTEIATNGTTTTGAAVPSWTTISFPTVDYENVGSPAMIERPSASQIKVKHKGIYLVHFDILANGGANNIGWQVQVLKNSVAIPQSISHGNARATIAECRSVGHSFPIELAIDDILELQVGVREASAVTVQPGSSFVVELRRMT